MDEEVKAITEAGLAEASRNQTAKRAVQILLATKKGFVLPSAQQKKRLQVEFMKRNLVLYGNAFDVLKVVGKVNLDDAAEIERNLDRITVCEIKSTGRILPADFKGYFFALTTAELLVAQSLKQRFKFIFVNTVAGKYMELTLQELFGRARGIYPTWSIRF